MEPFPLSTLDDPDTEDVQSLLDYGYTPLELLDAGVAKDSIIGRSY